MWRPILALTLVLAGFPPAAAQIVEEELEDEPPVARVEVPVDDAPAGEEPGEERERTSEEGSAAPAESEDADAGEPPVDPATEAEQRYLEGDLEAAAALYQLAAESAPDPRQRMTHLLAAAWIEHQLERPWRSREILYRGLGEDPDYPFDPRRYTQSFVEVFSLALEHVRSDRAKASSEVLRRGLDQLAAGDHTAARRSLEAALELVPGDPFALYNLALLETRLGRDEEAIAGYERLLAREAARPGSVPREVLARARGSAGLLYYRRGFDEDARRHLEEAVRLDPDDANAWNNLGLSRRRLDDAASAEEAFRRAAALDESSPQGSINLGVTLLQAGRAEEAAASLLEATRRQPSNADAWLNLGLARRALGDLEGALAAFDRAGEAARDDSASAPLAATYRALTLHDLDRPREAAAAARRSLELDAEGVEAWIYLGLAQHEMGELGAARESLGEAARLDPTRPEVPNNLGTVLVAMGDLEGAAAAFRRALTLRPGFPEAQENLRQVEEALAGLAASGTVESLAAPGQSAPAPPSRRPLLPLGLELDPIDYNYLGVRGALVERVRSGGPASRGGLRRGDVILNVDGRPVEGVSGLMTYLQREAPGDEVTLDVLRNGHTLRFRVAIR